MSSMRRRLEVPISRVLHIYRLNKSSGTSTQICSSSGSGLSNGSVAALSARGDTPILDPALN